MDCEKCGGRSHYEWADRLVLIGSFTARLCSGCSNAFHEYAHAHPLWRELAELDDRKALLRVAIETGQHTDPNDILAMRTESRRLDSAWYVVSKAWVHEKPLSVGAVDPSAASPGTPSTRV